MTQQFENGLFTHIALGMVRHVKGWVRVWSK
jgi:hypothetical protein